MFEKLCGILLLVANDRGDFRKAEPGKYSCETFGN